MNIFGIYGNDDGFPMFDVLHKDYHNRINENHVEIARRLIQGDARRYACILFVFRDGTSTAYTF